MSLYPFWFCDWILAINNLCLFLFVTYRSKTDPLTDNGHHATLFKGYPGCAFVQALSSPEIAWRPVTVAEMTPELESWIWEYFDDLESACRKFGNILHKETSARIYGITDRELRAIQRTGVVLRQPLMASLSDRDPEKAFALSRIASCTAPQITPDGCNRWVGPSQGRKMGQPGGVPVISFRGRMISARRILWNYTYPEPDPLNVGWNNSVRLRNSGCEVGSYCMNLNHWYKPQHTSELASPRIPHQKPSESPTLARLQKYTAEPSGLGGCERWFGAVNGGVKGSPEKGGTPVLSFEGRVVPARRLAWNLKHEGTSEELGERERLRNIGCKTASLCMNLDHWRKKLRVPTHDELYLSAIASPPEPEDGRLCASQQHWLPASTSTCPACAATRANASTHQRLAAFELGQRLRKQILRNSETAVS